MEQTQETENEQVQNEITKEKAELLEIRPMTMIFMVTVQNPLP